MLYLLCSAGGRPYSMGGEDGKDGLALILPGLGGAVGAQYLEQFLMWQGQADTVIAKVRWGRGRGNQCL